MSQGWISVHRQIQDHWLWAEKPFSKGQAWIDMLLLANHEDAKILIGNEVKTIKAGSFHSSEIKLANRWGWSKKKTHRFLECLESDQMIATERSKQGTTIFLTNYANFQYHGTTEEPSGNHAGTTEEPSGNTNNNDNNENNDNNSFSYRKKRGKKKAEINPSFDLEELEEKLKSTVTVI